MAANVGDMLGSLGVLDRRESTDDVCQMADLAWLAFLRFVTGISLVGFSVVLLGRVPPFDGFLGASEHFAYRGLEWVRPLPSPVLHLIAVVLGVTSAAMAAGFRHRWSAPIAAAAFAYLFFMDSAYYESVGYLVVLMLVLLVLSPADAVASCDVRRGGALLDGRTARLLVRFQVGCVYAFSGLSKWNADWLSGRTLEAMCPDYVLARALAPFVGRQAVFAGMAFGGMLFDLSIVPLLCVGRTRRAAFFALIVFHFHNALVLRLGLVPWIMLAVSTAFLPPDWPRRIGLRASHPQSGVQAYRGAQWIALAWMAVQIVLPLRRWITPGDPYFTESGFRFTWALRSRQKSSTAALVVVDRKTGERGRNALGAGLSPALAARVAADPHAIWQEAQRLARGRDVAIYADTWVTLNGSLPSRLIDPNIDLTRQSFPLFALPTWVRREPSRRLVIEPVGGDRTSRE